MITSTCPGRETLFQYSVGALDAEQRQALDEHLECCGACQATILTLDDADDTVAGRLRTPPGSESFLAEPQLRDALATAMAMPLSAPNAKGRCEPEEGRAAEMPRTLGEYQLMEELGHGGMGTVYKALQTKLDRVVAVKVLSRGRSGDRQAIHRFEREMKAVGKLAHPNIVQAYDAREIDGMPVLIMEFVDGLDLAEIVRRIGSVSVAEACELVRRTALALQYAHEHGLVHRDIKPSNIMLSSSLSHSGKEEVKLLDLGLARFYAEGDGGVRPVSAGEEMTDTGQAMGTADYMAPEQASDSRTVDIRADIYSLGCTLYKLLSGRAPFSGPEYRGTLDKLNAHVHRPVAPIRNLVPEVPERLAAVLDRMLAKDPGDRFATPADVATVLEPFCRRANLRTLLRRAQEQMHPLAPAECLGVPCPAGQRMPAAKPPLLLTSWGWKWFAGQLILLVMSGGLGFALGIMIRIHKDGKVTTVDIPPGSNARVTADGQLDVTLPGEAKSAEEANRPEVPAAADLKALHGPWKVVRVEKGTDAISLQWARFLSSDPETTSRIDFCEEDSKLLIIGQDSTKGGYVRSFHYTLDPTASPKKIDVFQNPDPTIAAGPGALGIYEIDGERLKIHLALSLPTLQEQAQRPKSFSIDPNSGDVLVVLQRYHGEDEKKIGGNWAIVTEIADGVAVAEQDRRTFGWSLQEADRLYFLVRYSGGAVWSVPFVLVGAQEPKRILLPDVKSDMSHGDCLDGIYRLDGDRLQIAYRANGPPPEKFESTPGSGVTYLALERPKPPATPPEVAVLHPIVRELTPLEDYSGLLEPAQTAEVRPRISGRLVKILVNSGATVKQGDVLFELDPAPFQAEVDKREADVRLAQLALDQTKAQLRDLKRPAVSDRHRLEESQAVKEAALTAAEEQSKVAKLNLASTRVTAPVSGRVLSTRIRGRTVRPIPIGTQVTDAMALAVIGSVDPIAFEVDAMGGRGAGFRDEVPIISRTSSPTRPSPKPGLPVLLETNGEEGYAHKGKVESPPYHSNPITGRTPLWRALFPNPDGRLMSRMAARARVITGEPYTALLLPYSAIRQEGGRPFVFVVTNENVLHRREIELGDVQYEGIRVVKKGLTADDWVIEKAPTRFLETWPDGMKVKPQRPAASPKEKPPTAGAAPEKR